MCRCGTLIPGPKRSGHDESVCFSNQPERREGGENQAERVGAAESVNEGLQRAETSLVYLQRLRAVAEPLSHSGRQSGSQLPPGEPRRHRCAGNACLRRRPERAPAVEGRLIFRDVHRRGRPHACDGFVLLDSRVAGAEDRRQGKEKPTEEVPYCPGRCSLGTPTRSR